MSLTPGTDTYCTREWADAYHAERPSAEQWNSIGAGLSAPSVEREKWLRAAFDDINALQYAEWPEPTGGYPMCVLKAQAEFALELYLQSSGIGIAAQVQIKSLGEDEKAEFFDSRSTAEKSAVLSAGVDRLLASGGCVGKFKVSGADGGIAPPSISVSSVGYVIF
jgi:hypothetical protein